MSNGREICEVKLSGLENFKDLSPEYYRKDYLAKVTKLHSLKFSSISQIAYVTDGEHGSPEWDEGTSIKYITAEHIKPNYILDDEFKTISKAQHERNNRAALKEKDVLIYSVGAYAGYAAMAEPHLFPANIPRSVAIARINQPSDVMAEYLTVFLNSSYGSFQSTRFRAGNSQPVLALEKIKQFLVPILNKDFQIKIAELYSKAYSNRLEAWSIYKQADNLLIEELGLHTFAPPIENTVVKSFRESFLKTGRLDAEYYQPKYEYAYQKLLELKPKVIVPFDSLLRTITNGQTPLNHDLRVGDVLFLTAEHISDFRINYDSDKRVLTEHHHEQLAKTAIEKHDLLITIKGKIGNAAIVEDVPRPTNINQDVGLLRLKEGVNPYYIAGYINSVLGRMFVQQICTGQINPFLGLGNLRTIPIPLFDNADELGQHIRQKVMEAEDAQSQSTKLLEIAKRAVEIAIEKNEHAALDFIMAAR